MVLWTPVPWEEVFPAGPGTEGPHPAAAGGYRLRLALPAGHLVASLGAGGPVVESLWSTDPMDYLRPQFQPGVSFPGWPAGLRGPGG